MLISLSFLMLLFSCEGKISENDLNEYKTIMDIRLGHLGNAIIMQGRLLDAYNLSDKRADEDHFKEAEELIRVINLSKVKPFVRLTSNNSDQIKRVLDSGAEGIIVPMVNNHKDAISAVEACYYPPLGKRSVGLARAQT